MADFDWRLTPRTLAQRYALFPVEGEEEWRDLVDALIPRGDWLAALDEFLRATRVLVRRKPCRVFISHQQADAHYAVFIAWKAKLQGFEYWLDVHDPVLAWANGVSMPPQMQSILIAAIIEMALLNCSHVITVQTKNTATSRWVPYEFGRVKSHLPVSTQAASWFDIGIYATSTADYLKLGVCTQTQLEVEQWLAREWASRTPSVCDADFHAVPWSGPRPAADLN